MSIAFPWLLKQWQQLISYKLINKLPSGMLITGPEGIGKLSLTKEYARYILCEQAGSSACGQCRSCLLFAAGSHPDFFLIQPEEKSITIKIEQIRELINALEHTSHLGGYQIAIISLAEQMNKAASNSLLKTLEEPRGKVLIILISNQSGSVAPTILSRCQQFKIPLPTFKEAQEWLSRELPPDTAAICLSIADNSPLKALNYASQDQQVLRNSLLTYLQQIQHGTIDPTTAALESVSLAQEQLSLLMTLTMDMIRIKFSIGEGFNHRDKIIVLSALCRNLSLKKLFNFLDDLLEATKLLANRNNINAQLLMEKIFINWRYNNDIS